MINQSKTFLKENKTCACLLRAKTFHFIQYEYSVILFVTCHITYSAYFTNIPRRYNYELQPDIIQLLESDITSNMAKQVILDEDVSQT